MSDKLKIACICADPGVSVNGWKRQGSMQIQDFVAALTWAGCDVHLFAANVEFSPARALSEATVHPLAGPPKRVGCLSQRKVSLLSNQILKLLLQEQGPFDLVYEWFSLWSEVGMQHAVDQGITGVLHIDTDIIAKLDRYNSLVSEATAQQFARRCFNNATAVITDSHDVANYLAASDVAANKTHIIPGGIRTSFDPRPTERVCERTGTFTVGYVGDLDSRHLIDDLICGFDRLHQQYSRSRLLVVAGGSHRQVTLKMINARGLSEVTTVTGRLAHSEERALRRHMDAIVVPVLPTLSSCSSTDHLLAHMASGAVVVAVDCAQTRLVIQDGVNGMLYEAGNISHLLDTLAKLRSYPLFAHSLSENARMYVREYHSLGNTCQKLLEIVHQDALREASTPALMIRTGT